MSVKHTSVSKSSIIVDPDGNARVGMYSICAPTHPSIALSDFQPVAIISNANNPSQSLTKGCCVGPSVFVGAF